MDFFCSYFFIYKWCRYLWLHANDPRRPSTIFFMHKKLEFIYNYFVIIMRSWMIKFNNFSTKQNVIRFVILAVRFGNYAMWLFCLFLLLLLSFLCTYIYVVCVWSLKNISLIFIFCMLWLVVHLLPTGLLSMPCVLLFWTSCPTQVWKL